MGEGGPSEGVHVRACHLESGTPEGVSVLSEGFWGEGGIQCLPPTIGICKEHVLNEPLPRPSLRWGGGGGGGGVTLCMTCQGTVEASTCWVSDASLLVQHLNFHLASAYSLRTVVWIHLSAILSADEALRDLISFAFVVSHLFFQVGATCSISRGDPLSR